LAQWVGEQLGTVFARFVSGAVLVGASSGQALPPDPSLAKRQAILDRAAAMLATPYVWGGNTPGRGMDCSAVVSST
jgi:cell wall-associated NlpC family hydrolase